MYMLYLNLCISLIFSSNSEETTLQMRYLLTFLYELQSDHDPRSPVYISTQGPLQSTVAQFWQMIWEQECTSIVMLTSLAEDNKTVCHQYWPSEGRHTYSNFEV